MTKKTVLSGPKGELRAIVVACILITLGVILPPHISNLANFRSPPIIEIREVEGEDNALTAHDIPLSRQSDGVKNLGEATSPSFQSREVRHTEAPTVQRFKAQRNEGREPPLNRSVDRTIHCRSFDPNTVKGDSLLAMGLPQNIVRNIFSYRGHNGTFKKSEDLLKIYGMDSTIYSIISGCIEIKRAQVATVYINQADTTTWASLPGIGRVLSTRIVKFRDRLGGFHSIGQIGETFGLPPETFNGIKSHLRLTKTQKPIQIQTATAEDLSGHPYISYKQAQAMINYFDRHGRPQDIKALSNLYIADSIWLEKIKPYLDFSKTSSLK